MTKKKVAAEKYKSKKECCRLVVFVLCCKKRMILSKKFYDKCCPKYQKAINELEKKLADIGVIKGYRKIRDEATRREWLDDANKKSDKICDTICDFAEKYLTPKEYWEYYMHHCDGYISYWCLKDRKKFSRRIAETAFFNHLYYNEEWNSIESTSNVEDGRQHFFNAYDDERFKLLFFQLKDYLLQYSDLTYDVTEQDFDYPHDSLKECFRQYERQSTRLPSDDVVKQYEKMKPIFDKIYAAKENVDEWFKLLVQFGDDDFVMDNVECRLGHNLLNVKLWKLYLAFLKEHGHCNKLVQMYSKYCRFFLEDSDMLEVYKSELAKHGKVDVPLDQICIIDVEEDVAEKEEEEDVTQDDENIPFDKSICSSFYDSDRNQKFSLLGPIIRYIAKNAGHRVLRKLFESCKYFYAKRPTPICYRLETDLETTYKCENLTLQLTAKPEFYLKKTYLTGSITVGTFDRTAPNFNHSFISSVISRLHRCEAKYIQLYHQHLTFDDLKCLIQHGGVVDLQIETCTIKDKRDDFVDLEQIVAHLPNIEILNLPQVKTNANTGHTLSKFKFYGKIRYFGITGITGKPFNAEEFLKFCIANRDEKSFDCGIVFNRGFNPEFVQSFKKTMDEYAKSCGTFNTSINLGVER